MKLYNLRFNNHKILGNLDLSFLKNNRQEAYDTIIFVGENGVGKTTILKELSDFLSGETFAGHFSCLEYESQGQIYRLELDPDAKNNFEFIRNSSSGVEKLKYGHERNSGYNTERMTNDLKDPRAYGSILSLARSDFQTKTIDKSGTSFLDNKKHERDNDNDFTSLKQLLIDLSNDDDRDFAAEHKKGNKIDYEDFVRNSRMYRFTKAFNEFFENLKYGSVRGDGGFLKIFFTKFGKEIPIESLSTGEKQIVFRGVNLLKNLNNMEGGLVLIDEPELSLHPKWQNKILKYYQNLFINPASGKMMVQLIVATHAERILASAFEEPDKNGVIVLKNDAGTISASQVNAPGVLPSVTAAETTYLAYNVPTVDYHIELFSYIQRTRGNGGVEMNVKETDDYIKVHRVFNPNNHHLVSSFTDRGGRTRNYDTLPSFVRNGIDHPNPANPFTLAHLKTSIELLREIIQNP